LSLFAVQLYGNKFLLLIKKSKNDN